MADADIFSDLVCVLGEGPAAHPELERLFWFDIRGKRLLERRFDTSGTTVHDLPFMASVMAVIDADRQLIVSETGLHVREMRTGRLTPHTPIEADDDKTRSNDGRVHPSGALWFSTMGKNAETGAGSLYWFFRGEVRKLRGDLSIVNAICFAPDGGVAYFADSPKRTIWRIKTDPLTGLPTGEPQVFVTMPATDGVPDGAVTDAHGFLWNARWGGGSLDCYGHDGRRVRSVALPATQTTCPAFVGAAADRVVVTSATQGMNAATLAAEPLAGQTFILDIAVAGRFDPPVRMA